MKKISIKLIVVTNLLLFGFFLGAMALNHYFLELFYLKEKKDQLDEIVADIKQNADPQHYQKYISDKAIEALIFEIKDFSSEEAFNEAIRAELHQRRAYFTKIWYFESDMEIINYGGEKRYLSRQPALKSSLLSSISKTNDGKVVFVGFALAAMDDAKAIIQKFFLIIGSGAFLLSAFCISWYAFRITRPISAIHQKAQAIANLDFRDPLKVQTGDELEELAASVNDMSSKLNTTLNHLQEANQALKEDLQEKEKIDKLRKEFIGNVSHELKTPIALIGGYAHGLQDGVGQPEDRDYFSQVIIEEVQNMSVLVEELLELSELEAGFQQLTLGDFDIETLIHHVKNKYILDFDEKSIQYVEQTTSLQVKADSRKVERILHNLFSNAVKFVYPHGKISITIEPIQKAVLIKLSNTGDPIEESQLSEIWKPFVKSKNKHKKYGGAGLGLAITAGILKEHKSQYGVTNLDNGVEFYFTLPLS